MELNEFLTRKQMIDVMLREQGWVVGDRTKVIDEMLIKPKLATVFLVA